MIVKFAGLACGARRGVPATGGGRPPVEGGRVRLAEKLPDGSGPGAAEVGWRRFW
jgi:hypothetical protein